MRQLVSCILRCARICFLDMTTVYFEITVGNIIRYNAKILPALPDDIFLVYDVLSDFQATENPVFCYKRWSARKVRTFFLSHSVDRLVVNSFRMTDCAAISVAKSLGIQVFYVQHGFYQPFIRRRLSFFGKFAKFFDFSRLFFSACGVSLSTLIYPFALLGFASRKAFSKNFLSVDVAFFWSSYWRDWHLQNFWVLPLDSVIVGDPNLGQVYYQQCYNSNRVLFVSQSLVEDSRLSLGNYISVLSKVYSRCLQFNKIPYVRFHPRQSQLVKSSVLDLGFLEDNGIGPFALCIAGYSSVIPAIASRGIPIVLVDLDGEPIPISILKLGTSLSVDDICFGVDYKVASRADLDYFWGIVSDP